MATKTAPKLESSATEAGPTAPAEEAKPAPGPAQDATTPVEASRPAPAPAAPVTWLHANPTAPPIPISGSAQSAEIGALMGALAMAQSDLRGALKDSKNPHLRNSYADLTSVWEAWQEVGPRHRLGLVQVTEANERSVTILTTLGHNSGQWIRGSLTLPWSAQKGITDAQAIGSALTYARRYSLAALVGVCPEDDDGNAAGRPAEHKIQVDRYPSGNGNGGNGNGKHPAAERREAKLATGGQDPAQGAATEDLRRLKSEVWKLVCVWCDIKREDGSFDEAGTKIEAGVKLKEFRLVPINPETDLADLALASPAQLAQLRAKLQAALLDSPEKIPGDPF